MLSPSSPRLLLIPSAGMGHLVPFARLATALTERNIAVSLLAVRPTVSAAESRLLSSLPSSIVRDFNLPLLDPSLNPSNTDPFFLRMESLLRSVQQLAPLLRSSSALVVDIFAASTILPIAVAANIPCFVLSTSSATMLAVCAAFRSYGDIDITGFIKISSFLLPGSLRDPNHFFTNILVENGRALALANGILVNTFEDLEPEVIAALNSSEVFSTLPPVYVIGPLPSLKKEGVLTSSTVLRWMEAQPERSVMYVCFGSRTVMSAAQMTEIRGGLEMSGCRFLLVIKRVKVDQDEDPVEMVEELVGEGRGLVVRDWVEQEAVLRHKSVGGFLSHCGWNSVMEAVEAGVRVFAWPRTGDQRLNAGILKGKGVGLWVEEWAWEDDEGVVTSEEIGRKVRELMENGRAGEMARKVAAEAAGAVGEGGSSDISFRKFVEELIKN